MNGVSVGCFALVAAVFPLATAGVFAWGWDRAAAADLVAGGFVLGVWGGMLSVYWREGPARLALVWTAFAAVITASWELPWLLLRQSIATGRDSWWFYPWWAYIDGGDYRYAAPDTTLLVLESLSVANGVLTVAAVWWWRTAGLRRRAQLAMLAVAAVHVYSVMFYFLSELYEGLPGVDQTRFVSNVLIKFFGANAPWLVFPLLVGRWVVDDLAGGDGGGAVRCRGATGKKKRR